MEKGRAHVHYSLCQRISGSFPCLIVRLAWRLGRARPSLVSRPSLPLLTESDIWAPAGIQSCSTAHRVARPAVDWCQTTYSLHFAPHTALPPSQPLSPLVCAETQRKHPPREPRRAKRYADEEKISPYPPRQLKDFSDPTPARSVFDNKSFQTSSRYLSR